MRNTIVVSFVVSIACSSTSVRKVEPDSPDPAAAIAIEVYANGRDADQPPGPRVTEGDTVQWTYIAVNTGTVELTGVAVEDDTWGPVTCSRMAINPGEQTLCTLVAQPPAGLMKTTGTVTATAPDGEVVTASDPSHVLVDAIATLAPGEVRPAVCDTHLLMANPTRDSITEVELATRATGSLPVGDEPIDLVVAADCSSAVTLNDGGDEISVVDLTTGDVATLAVRPGRNRLDMSPDGGWVVAWADPARAGLGCVAAGTCPLGEVSVVDLAALAVEDFATGMEPFDLLFAPDSSRAVLAGDLFVGAVELATGAVTFARYGAVTETMDEAVMGPDGDYLWVRDFELDRFVLVTLSPYSANSFVGDGITDLELTADGSELIALVPEAGEIHVYDAANPLDAPTVEAASLGTSPRLVMAESGEVGVTFEADASTDTIGVWLRVPDSFSPWTVAKPVRAAELTPDGTTALVIHTFADVDGVEDEHTAQHLVSVIETNSNPLSANVVVLPSEPVAWAIAPTGGWGMVAAEGSHDLIVIDFATGLVDVVDLPAPAKFAGFLPNTGTVDQDVAWVSHALEVSFVSPASGSVETISP